MIGPSIVDAAGRSRLLPASIPFRYFATAGVYHVIAWSALVAAAEDVPWFAGGLGPVLATVHLFALGMLAMTAVGAGLQLLPVATVQSVRSVAAARAIWWLLAPGIAALAGGMWTGRTPLLGAGALATVAALATFAWLFAANLAGARRMRTLAAFGWGAWIALVALLATGFLLVEHYAHGLLADSRRVAIPHMTIAAFGFMGLLAAGFSHLLIPMLAIARVPPENDQRRVLAGWAIAAVVFVAGELAGAEAVTRALAALLALGAAGYHVFLLQRALGRRARRGAATFLVEIRVAWAMLFAALVAGGALALGGGAAPAAAFGLRPALFGALVIVGWLVTLLCGLLQRIVPFLASVHAKPARGAPPLVSSLSPALPLRIHVALHVPAVAMLALGIALGAGWLVRLAALAGLGGAIALAVFLAVAMWRSRIFRAKAPEPAN